MNEDDKERRNAKFEKIATVESYEVSPGVKFYPPKPSQDYLDWNERWMAEGERKRLEKRKGGK